MEHQPINAVLAALNLTPGQGSALLAAIRRRPEWEAVPVIAVADSAEEINKSQWRAQGFLDCQTKFDSTAILEAVTRFVSASTLDELEFAGEVR